MSSRTEAALDSGAVVKYPPSHWGSWLAYGYLLRVPLLIGLVLFGFPFAALINGSPLRALFENLFFLDATATFLMTVVAFALGWSIVLTARLVLLNGERFGLKQVITKKDFPKWVWWVSPALAVPAVVGPLLKYLGSHPAQVWHNALAAIMGVAFAYFLGYGSLWLAIVLSPKSSQPDPPTFPAVRPMRNWLAWASDHTVLPGWFTAWLRGKLAGLPLDLRAGYIDDRRMLRGADNPGLGLPWAAHWLVVSFAALTFILYVSLGVYKSTHLGEATPIPALAWVWFLLLNLNWILSFLTFLLDRFRVPLLIPLGLLALLGLSFPSSDHYYQFQNGVTPAPIRPHEALQWRAAAKKPIIVVATAGGGIQAAAWTVQVLTGLQKESRRWKNADFAESVALISSVSGGAVGSMFFLNEYGPGPGRPGFQLPDQGGNFKRLVERASASALDDVAWALVYRDIPGIFLPSFLRPSSAAAEGELVDRGRMLELAWQSRMQNFANLSAWRTGVKEGWRPAAIFNATIAETGEPLLLSTTDFDEYRDSHESRHPAENANFDENRHRTLNPAAEQPRWRTFYELYPGADLPVVTAVRLAAAFPFVSPAARARTSVPAYHVIDGGYYDNYGVASAAEWLDEAFTAMSKMRQDLPEVLVIQIRSFPDDARPAPKSRGWFFQLHAPATGLLRVRTTAQLVRDRNQLQLLEQRWRKNGIDRRIRFAGFKFPASDAPLSWKMNTAQRDAIEREWEKVKQGDDLRQVRCMFEPSGQDCAKLRDKAPW